MGPKRELSSILSLTGQGSEVKSIYYIILVVGNQESETHILSFGHFLGFVTTGRIGKHNTVSF